MKITIKEKDCKHLKDISVYNSNYYRLPFKVNGFDILYESYDGAEVFEGWSIGEIYKEKYVPHYWLHTESHDEEFIFDSKEIRVVNKWT